MSCLSKNIKMDFIIGNKNKGKSKNIIKMLNDLKLTGLRPVINFITYWDNETEGEESFTAVEFVCRDGNTFYKTLDQRRPESAESSAGESMADRRIPRKRVPPNRLVEENDEDTAGASSTAPTQQVSLQKMKEENAFLKAKIKFLEDKCKDIESERDFLRSSLTNALSAKEDMMGASYKSKLDDAASQSSSTDDDLHTEREKKTKRRGKVQRKKKHCKVDSSSSCASSTSFSSQSSSSPAPRKSSKKKNKTKKRNAIKKQKYARVIPDSHPAPRIVFLPEQAINRYKKVLAYLKSGTTKTQAFFKCGVDRKTIADTAAIAELEACNKEAYDKLRSTFQKGQKLSDFAERCKEFCRQESLQSMIDDKKKAGMLIDFCERHK